MGKTLGQISKDIYTSEDNTPENIQLGCLQRIALSCEAMAYNHTELIRDLENYKRWYKEKNERIKSLEASNAALRGVITKMKNNQASAGTQQSEQ